MGKYTKKKARIDTAVASATVSDAGADFLELRSRRLHKTTCQPNSRRRTRSPCAAALEMSRLLSSGSGKDSGRKRSTRVARPCTSSSSSIKNHIISTSPARDVTVPPHVEAEVEEFLTHAEESLQRHYLDKYNFDFMNGVPMPSGRYEWIEMRP